MKQKSIYILFILISFSALSQKSLDEVLRKHNKNDVSYISAAELHVLLPSSRIGTQDSRDIVILDSREKREFDVSHIPTASHVGFKDFSKENISEIIENKDTAIVVYCTLGIRSQKIAAKLQKAGYTNIKNLYGGICEWKNNDYSVFDANNIETDKVHTYSKQWSKWLENGTVVYD